MHDNLDQEAINGEALALGLYKEMEKPTFIANLLFLSNVLTILGNLSRTFQMTHLNLLSVEQIIIGAIAQLNVIKNNVLKSGYMADYNMLTQSVNTAELLDEGHFVNNAASYLNALISNLRNQFPQVHILKLLRYFQPENINHATPLVMLELGEFLQEDGHKIWLEFAGYKSFIETLPEP